MENIEQRVSAILAEQFCRAVMEIDLSADLVQAYTSDSLDLVELVMAIEDDFGLEIPDETMWNFRTGQQVVDYLKAKVPA